MSDSDSGAFVGRLLKRQCTAASAASADHQALAEVPEVQPLVAPLFAGVSASHRAIKLPNLVARKLGPEERARWSRSMHLAKRRNSESKRDLAESNALSDLGSSLSR